MSIGTCLVWHCDLCGYEWIVMNRDKVPRQCPKCRKTKWNGESTKVDEHEASK